MGYHQFPQPIEEVEKELSPLNYTLTDIADNGNPNKAETLAGSEHYSDFVTGLDTKLSYQLNAAEISFGWTSEGPMAHSDSVVGQEFL